MAEKISTIQENYSKNLKASDYVETMAGVFQDVPEFLNFTMEFLKNVFDSGRFEGSKLLEIGSGAMVHNIASASAFFPNILMSDYVEDNCEAMKRWLGGQSSVKQFLEAPARLEGYQENLEQGVQTIETRIKKAVKQVVRCDVLNDAIFMEEVKAELAPPYDLVLSSLCLEAAVPDLQGFVLALKRVNKLLRPGGGLILVGFLGGKYWKCGETDFHYIDTTESDVRKALADSGFENIDMKIHDKFEFWYEHDKFYCLAAKKP